MKAFIARFGQLALTSALVVALAFVLSWRFHRNEFDVERLQRVQMSACEDANRIRAAEVRLWRFIIDLSPAPTAPEEKARLERFLDFLNTTFASTDCSTLTVE